MRFSNWPKGNRVGIGFEAWCLDWTPGLFFQLGMYVLFCFFNLFLAVLGLHCGARASHCSGFSLLKSMGSRHTGSGVVAHRLSCSVACEIFPDQGSNLYPLHCQTDS